MRAIFGINNVICIILINSKAYIKSTAEILHCMTSMFDHQLLLDLTSSHTIPLMPIKERKMKRETEKNKEREREIEREASLEEFHEIRKQTIMKM